MSLDEQEIRLLMIIDDEVDLLDAIRDQVEALGYQVVAATSIAQAEGLLKTRRPHAILCDVMLPIKTGVEFLRDLRAQGNDLPLVFLTGSRDQVVPLEAIRLGALDFLAKPFDVNELVAVVERVLDIGVRQRQINDTMQRLKVEFPAAALRLEGVERDQKYLRQMSAFNHKHRG